MEKLKELFVPYNLAVKLKEKGFDEPCFSFYSNQNKENKLFFDVDVDDNMLTALNQNKFEYKNISHIYRISAPSYDQVVNWLNAKHSIYITALPYRDSEMELCWYYSLINDDESLPSILCNEDDLGCNESDYFDSYHDALNEAIIESLKLI